MAFKISHRVGHAETTAGKQSPDGVKEWTQADAICDIAMAELAKYEGVEQRRFDDPTGKVDRSISTMCREINAWGAHVHLDWHLNAHGDGSAWTEADGIEVFTAASKPREAVELAKKLQANLVAATGFDNRGVKHKDWDMLVLTDMTAALMELGFMTNKKETEFIRSPEGMKKIAMAVVAALVAQYGLKKKVSAKEGWLQENGMWYYYKSGVKKTGWLLDKGTWYFLKQDGSMAENEWLKYSEGWYYLGKGGGMAKGWHFLDWNGKKDWYYFHPVSKNGRKEGQMAFNEEVTVRVAAGGKMIP